MSGSNTIDDSFVVLDRQVSTIALFDELACQDDKKLWAEISNIQYCMNHLIKICISDVYDGSQTTSVRDHMESAKNKKDA